ncbi:RNA-directed DNA polymerase from mobile element jockey-like protein [Pitangus sulphuratus]|nr:RNA-directed DNA polymerase from mobile element jockey-like protein [Pitangus sulphuratus]
MYISKEHQRVDPGNYSPVSLTSVSGMVMEHVIWSVIRQHLQDNQGIRPNQQGFQKGGFCQTKLNSFYDQVICLAVERKPVDIVCLDFSKAFDTISYGILLEKLAAHGLGRCFFAGIRTG